jgi:transcriptional regulator with XRE-family HTH domain
MDKRLRDLRERLGWSQAQMAQRLRINHSSVSRIEAGTQNASGPVIALIEMLEAEVAASEVHTRGAA